MTTRGIYASAVLGAMLVLAFAARSQERVSECASNTGVDFQIVTDKQSYRPQGAMRVKFLVTNAADTPLYLRHMDECASPLGFYRLSILDKHGGRMPVMGCFANDLMEKIDPVEMFSNPKSGVLLEPGEIYGSQASFELPAKKGTYRVEAELFTGRLFEKQLQVLAERHMRVLQSLQCRIPAPSMTITVR